MNKNLYYFIRSLIMPIKDLVNLIPSNANILDLGCGKAIVLKNLKNYKKYTGVDLDSKNIASLSNLDKDNVSFIKADCIKYIDNPLNKFDYFLLIDVVHHLPANHQISFIKSLLGKMKKNDHLIIKDISNKSKIKAYWNIFHDLIISRQLINYCDFNLLLKSIDNNNYLSNKFIIKKNMYDHIFIIIKKIN
ncbi:methyltransferase domain-containing protein [Alphaproteobacteria bacterium]|nr:methyltransferase domain-containing protein [Alphaproteobacteria bacterium]